MADTTVATIEVISPGVTIPPAAYSTQPSFVPIGTFVEDINGNEWMAANNGYSFGAGDSFTLQTTAGVIPIPLLNGGMTAAQLVTAITALSASLTNLTPTAVGGALVLTMGTGNVTVGGAAQTLAQLGFASGAQAGPLTGNVGPFQFSTASSFTFPSSNLISILTSQAAGGTPTRVLDNQVTWVCAYDGAAGGPAAVILGNAGVALMQISIVNGTVAHKVVAVSPGSNLLGAGTKASITNDLQSILSNLFPGPPSLPLPVSSTTVVTYLAMYDASVPFPTLDNTLPRLVLESGTVVVCTVASDTTNLVQSLPYSYPFQSSPYLA